MKGAGQEGHFPQVGKGEGALRRVILGQETPSQVRRPPSQVRPPLGFSAKLEAQAFTQLCWKPGVGGLPALLVPLSLSCPGGGPGSVASGPQTW